MILVLPWPPTVNTYYRMVNNRMIISSAGRLYRSVVAAEVMTHRNRETYLCELAMTVSLYPPDKRKRDADNVIKALWDAMTKAGVYLDDSQIKDYRVRMLKPDPDKRGWVSVTVQPLGV